MSDKLEALSQPVTWALFEFSSNKLYHSMQDKLDAESYLNQVHQSNDSITLTIKPTYSQEYVTALLAALEAMKAKTSTAMGVGNGSGNLFVYGDYDSIKAAQLIVLENEKLRAALEEKDQRIAELEQRLQQPIKLRSRVFEMMNVGGGHSIQVVSVKAVKEIIRAAGFKAEVEGE